MEAKFKMNNVQFEIYETLPEKARGCATSLKAGRKPGGQLEVEAMFPTTTLVRSPSGAIAERTLIKPGVNTGQNLKQTLSEPYAISRRTP